MAQSFTTDEGITLYEPGAYVATSVIAGQGGIAAAGVVTLISESEEGPHWSEEADVNDNEFGPDQLTDVIRKYGSGRIVDAFSACISANADPAIVGAVQSIKIIKTNKSIKASSDIDRDGFGTFATIEAVRAGTPGNLIKYRTETSSAEVSPNTGLISYTPDIASPTSFNLRTNGGDQKAITVAANSDATTVVAQIEDIDKGILANGGEREDPLASLAGISVTGAAPAADELTITIPTPNLFAVSPEVGDTLVIPDAGQYGATSKSVLAGGGDENLGSYIVTSVVNTASSATISCKAINIAASTAATSPTAINANEDDFITYKPIQISNETGMDRQIASDGWDYVSTVSGGINVVFGITTASTTWNATPKTGDTFKFGSVVAGVTAGFYLVISATSTTVSLVRLSSGSAGTSGASAGVLASEITDLKPVIDGYGKSLEIDGDVSGIFKTSAGAAVTFSDSILYSSSEYESTTTISRDTVEDSFDVGGEIAAKFGTTKASAKIVISDSKIDFWEGASVVFSTEYSQYKTLSDLVGYVNSLPDYFASLGSSKFTNTSPADLDRGTYYISSVGWQSGRIKADAKEWLTETNQSGLASTSLSSQSGMPEEIVPDRFLSSGARAGTSGLEIVDAILACDDVTTNFVVTCFSKDASDDIVEGKTDSSSTYTIDAINALMRNHAISNSRFKAKQNRVVLVSKSASYADQKTAAADVGSFRLYFSIQNQKIANTQGVITEYQPWMSSVIAAGQQAAAGFKGIVKKQINTNGVYHESGDFNIKKQKTDALKAGLLVAEPISTGGYRWVSDQSSYTIDNNFVYNSLQAVYLSDLMALSLIASFDRAIAGRSVAETSATAALGFLEGELFNFKRLKWIASSNDAPLGFKNAKVRIQGKVMSIQVEVKLAGIIYFVPINLQISEVSQEA